jgi:hypothetical protein
MKLAGLVILGLITSGIIYWLLFMLLIKLFGHIGEEGILINILGVTPLALLIGSFPTGYFSYNDIENKWGLTSLAPGLYYGLLLMWVAGLSSLNDCLTGGDPIWHIAGALGIGLLIGLYWWLVSAGGVFLGYFLRERLVKWWYGD